MLTVVNERVAGVKGRGERGREGGDRSEETDGGRG